MDTTDNSRSVAVISSKHPIPDVANYCYVPVLLACISVILGMRARAIQVPGVFWGKSPWDFYNRMVDRVFKSINLWLSNPTMGVAYNLELLHKRGSVNLPIAQVTL